MNRKLRLAYALLGLLVVASCKLFAKDHDPATGNWAGQWFFQMGAASMPGGKLDCVVERVEKDKWKAVFTAQWGKTNSSQGQTGSYNVELFGTRQGEKVVFGGDVNLGATSGVFNWNGEVVGDVFSGKYTSKMVNGTFEMKKVEAEAAK